MAPLLFRGTRGSSSPAPARATTSLSQKPPAAGSNGKFVSLPRKSSSEKKAAAAAAAHLPSPASSTRYLLTGEDRHSDLDWLPEGDSLPDLIQLDSSRFSRGGGVVEEDDDDEFFALETTEQIRLCSAALPSSAAGAWPRFQTACDDSAVLKPSIFSVQRGKVGGEGKGDDEAAAKARVVLPPLLLLPREEFGSEEKGHEKTAVAQKPSDSVSPPGKTSEDEVVVLKVSLHCKGCEGKVRKHLKRMEGVTSFDIDFKAKKVTVVGNVTPLSVLSSISKVKNAQLWTLPPPPPPLPPALA